MRKNFLCISDRDEGKKDEVEESSRNETQDIEGIPWQSSVLNFTSQ